MKKVIFSLLVAAVALGGSAFKNVEKTIKLGAKQIPAGFLVQTSANRYHYRAADNGTCFNSSDNSCLYEIITSTNSIPAQTTYNAAQANSYVNSNWATASPEKQLYLD